MSTMCLMKRIE